MFDRTSNLDGNQIINYKVDANEKWCVLVGIAPGAPERYGAVGRPSPWIAILPIPQAPARQGQHAALLGRAEAQPGPGGTRRRLCLRKGTGNGLSSKHAKHAKHASQLSGSDTPSSVIAFAQKSLTNGQVVSKVHIIEVGPPPGVTWHRPHSVHTNHRRPCRAQATGRAVFPARICRRFPHRPADL